MSRKYLYPIYIWSLAAFFYFYENSLTSTLSIMTQEVSHSFHIGHFKMSLFSSTFFFAYAIMQIPTGILLDHSKIRNIAIIASASCALGCFVFALSSSYAIALVGRFIMGLGSAFAALTTFKIASSWFSPSRFTTLSGLLLTCGNLGAVAGQLTVYFLDDYSWNAIIVALGVVGLMIMSLNAFTMAESKKQVQNKLTWQCLVKDLRTILTSRNIWLMFGYGMLLYAPYLTLQSMIGKPFIQETLHLSAKLSTQISTMMFYGFCIGAPLLGFTSDYIQRRKPLLVVSAFGTTVVLIMMTLPAFQTIISFFLLFFMFGFFVSGFLPSFSVIKETVSPKRMGTAFGLMNTFNSLGGVLIPPLIGLLTERAIQNSVTNPYQSAIVVLPFCTIIGMILALFSKETHCKQVP